MQCPKCAGVMVKSWPDDEPSCINCGMTEGSWEARVRYVEFEAVEEKQCTKCKAKKERGEFVRNRHEKSGLSSWCKECRKKAWEAWKRRQGE